MDPLARQEELIKKSQGENYVGKRQAMVAARLQARGLKGRAYYDSADHSMQQQKNQQEKQAQHMQSVSGENDVKVEEPSSQGARVGAVAKPLNKFASESGSLQPIRRSVERPESGSLGALGKTGGSQAQTESLVTDSEAEISTEERASHAVISSPSVSSRTEGSLGTPQTQQAQSRSVLGGMPLVASPQPSVANRTSLKSYTIAAPKVVSTAQRNSNSSNPTLGGNQNTVSAPATTTGSGLGSGSGIRSTGIKIRSMSSGPYAGNSEQLSARPNNPSVASTGMSSGSKIAVPSKSLGGSANEPGSGVRTVKLASGGVRSVNLGINVRQPMNTMPKAYDLNREQLHRGATGISPLGGVQQSRLSNAPVRQAVHDSDDDDDDME